MPIHESARAKVNLTLKVLGRRADGYHALESLITFAGVGDEVSFEPGAAEKVTVEGPFAGAIDGENLLLRTLRALKARDPQIVLGSVSLDKRLPVAAGLGGGSADAAALLRAVRQANPAATLAWTALAAELGADVAICLKSAPALVWGVGERICELAPATSSLPPLSAVLVNPRRPLATRDVFAALSAGPVPATLHALTAPPGPFRDLGSLLAHMKALGNDLEAPALRLLPVIADVKAALLGQAACRHAAMSGSGPTCFGLFADGPAAAAAAAAISRSEPSWWVAATGLDFPAVLAV